MAPATSHSLGTAAQCARSARCHGVRAKECRHMVRFFRRRAADWLNQPTPTPTPAPTTRGRRRTPGLRPLVLEDRTVPSTAAGLLDFGFEASAVAAGAYRYG